MRKIMFLLGVIISFVAMLSLATLTTHAAIATDGSSNGFSTGTGTANTVLTTTQGNDIILLFLSWDSAGSTTFTISDTAGLSWSLRASENTGSSTAVTREYYATSTNPLTNDKITATASGGTSALKLIAVGVSGANTITPFDANALMPSTANKQSSVAVISANVNTNNANDMLILFIVPQGGSTVFTYNAGFTQTNYVTGSETAAVANKVITTLQTNIPIGASFTPSGATSLIVDALQQAPPPASTSPSLTIATNPAVYGQSDLIQAAAANTANTIEILINSVVEVSGTGTQSYTVCQSPATPQNCLGVGTYTVNAYDPGYKTSNIITLTINANSPVLTFPVECATLSIWTSTGCQTTANIITVNSQVTATLWANANGPSANWISVGTTATSISSNSIAVGNYMVAFNALATGNYLANSISYSYYIYVPLTSTNSVGNTLVNPTTQGIASNQLKNYYPIMLSANSSSHTMSYFLNQSYNGGANTILASNVASLTYIPPSNQLTGNYLYTIIENETIPFGHITFTYNSLTNMIDIQNALTFNNPVVQYLPNQVIITAGSFTAIPKKWRIFSSPTSATQFNNSPTTDQFQSNALIIPVNVELTYGFTVFNITLTNNPLVQTTITQNSLQFMATNAGTTNIIGRKILNVSTYDQGSFLPLLTNNTSTFTWAMNNYTGQANFQFSNANQFNVYMSQSNYMNPPIVITNSSLLSSNPSYFKEVNNFCPISLNNGQFSNWKSYLAGAAGQIYTFQIYQGAGFAPVGAYMVVQSPNPSNGLLSQVQIYKITANPFADPLIPSQEYKFTFYNSGCSTLLYSSALTTWISPISITIPLNITIPAFPTTSAIASCSTTFNTPANVYDTLCIGSDITNKTKGWKIDVVNATSILNVTFLLNQTNKTGSSFSFFYALNRLPGTKYKFLIYATGFPPGAVTQILDYIPPQSNLPVKPLAQGGGIIVIFLLMAFVFFGADDPALAAVMLVFGIFLASAVYLIDISSIVFYAIAAVVVILAFLYETDRI